jgi:hypothetical protein
MAERIMLVCYGYRRPAPSGEDRSGWCWRWSGEPYGEWHELPDVPHGRETWAPGLIGDGQHLDKARASVEAVAGPCVWPPPDGPRLSPRRILIDGTVAMVHHFSVGVPVGPNTSAHTGDEPDQEDTFVHVTVCSPHVPTGKRFRFPKDYTVGSAAKVAAGKYGFDGSSANFQTVSKVVFDRKLTLEAAGVQNGDMLELVDPGAHL